MKMRFFVPIAAAATMLFSQMANATTFNYSFVGVDTDTSFSFSVDDTTAMIGGKSGAAFFFDTVVDVGTGLSLVEVDFFDLASLGGLSAGQRYFGEQLYTGSAGTEDDPMTPTLLTGEFTLINTDGNSVGVLTVTSDGVDPVPEPASWAMMLTGVGLAGLGARRRIRTGKLARA